MYLRCETQPWDRLIYMALANVAFSHQLGLNLLQCVIHLMLSSSFEGIVYCVRPFKYFFFSFWFVPSGSIAESFIPCLFSRLTFSPCPGCEALKLFIYLSAFFVWSVFILFDWSCCNFIYHRLPLTPSNLERNGSFSWVVWGGWLGSSPHPRCLQWSTHGGDWWSASHPIQIYWPLAAC